MIASAAALKTVRYSGYGCLTCTVHCAMTPAMAMTIARRGPSSRSAIRSAAYDTDSVEPLESAIGSVTFQVDVTQPSDEQRGEERGPGNAVRQEREERERSQRP